MSGLPRRFIQTSIVLLFALWVPSFAQADEIWTVVAKKTHFGPGVNTLVLKPHSGIPAAGSAKANSDAGSRFLVIAGGSLYLAVDEQIPSPAGVIIKTGSGRWPHKKLIQIGQGIFRIYCYRCFLFSDDVWAEITLQFLPATVDPRRVYPLQEVTSVVIESPADESSVNGRP